MLKLDPAYGLGTTFVPGLLFSLDTCGTLDISFCVIIIRICE